MTRRNTIVALVLPAAGFLAAAVWAQQAAGPPARAAEPASVSSETEATCLLKIRFDPQVLPLDARCVQYLLASAGVARETGRELLAAEGENIKVAFEALSMTGGITGPVSVGRSRGGYGGYYGGPVTTDAALPPGLAGLSGDGSAEPFGGGSAGAAPAAGAVLFYPPTTTSQEHVLLGRLVVSSPAGKAHEVMKGITRRFETTLAEASRSEIERIEGAMRPVALQVERARVKLRQLQEARRDLLASVSLNDLSREAILEMSRRLETERQDVAVKREALQARLNATREQVKVIAADHHAAADKVEAIKQHLAKLKEEAAQLAEMANAPGTDPDAEKRKLDAKRALAQLQSEHARMQDNMERAAAADAAAMLKEANAQMSNMSVDLTECEMRFKAIDERCQGIRDLLAKADDYEMQVGLELPLARINYENARRREEELRIQIDSFRPPTVTVLGG